MKKNLYERPSLEVLVLEHKEMLMTSGDKVTRDDDYGNPITQDWARKYEWEEEEWEEEEE